MDEPIAVVLAAGKGVRMESDLPKVLIPVLGRPMVEYVLDALNQSGIQRVIVIVGYQADLVKQTLAGRDGVVFATQTEQLGTGHAVMACRGELEAHSGPVLIVAGDSPLIQSSSVAALLDDFQQTRPACLMGTAQKENPLGLGRVVRDDEGQFVKIVEEKDATVQERAITEVNMSTYLFDTPHLLSALEQLSNENSQGEYYLTDCPGILLDTGQTVRAANVLQSCESLSINNMAELAAVEDELRRLAGS